jgi:hypothetical protein
MAFETEFPGGFGKPQVQHGSAIEPPVSAQVKNVFGRRQDFIDDAQDTGRFKFDLSHSVELGDRAFILNTFFV